jgi:hypothetical protein
MKVINNFLEKEDFLKIKNLISGDNFPWYINESKIPNSKIEKKYNWQLTHTFFRDHSFCSPYFNDLNPIFDTYDLCLECYNKLNDSDILLYFFSP